jgi:P-type Ca2+ transporter type 2C
MTARAGWFAGEPLHGERRGLCRGGEIGLPATLNVRPFLLPMALCTDSQVRDGA